MTPRLQLQVKTINKLINEIGKPIKDLDIVFLDSVEFSIDNTLVTLHKEELLDNNFNPISSQHTEEDIIGLLARALTYQQILDAYNANTSTLYTVDYDPMVQGEYYADISSIGIGIEPKACQ